MREEQVSQMSLLTAYQRGYHFMYDEPKIFNDSFAFELLTEEERKLFGNQYIEIARSRFPEASFSNEEAALEWFIQSITSTSDIVSRARYTEDRLQEMFKHGLQQYVILGAGMDTFAYRQLDMEHNLQVFEIDHPSTQAFKLERINNLGWKKPRNLHYVPIDFNKENLETALQRSSFDSDALSLFSWLGVTYYLPQDAVFSTLRTIAEIAPSGSTIIFDYYNKDAFNPDKVSPRVQGWKQYAAQVGEPIITGFDPETLALEIDSLGLRLYENLSPVDIENRYFLGRKDNYHATEHTHYACVVVK